jgi:hypothetical protein
MKKFTQEEFDSSKPTDALLCMCDFCGKDFQRTKRGIQMALLKEAKRDACSRKCSHSSADFPRVEINCFNCGCPFLKRKSQFEKTKNHFCSQKCSGIYHKKHQTHGNRRSKLEIWLEKELVELYPAMELKFNRRDEINSELDIYIPMLKLAFELNGIFHYEPIYGADKLNQIQNNDLRKFQACLDKGIELCIIDTSQQKYFKEKTAKKYLDIIIDIIKKKMDA